MLGKGIHGVIVAKVTTIPYVTARIRIWKVSSLLEYGFMKIWRYSFLEKTVSFNLN